MKLLQLCKHYIYDNENKKTPDHFARFKILCPEHSSHGAEVRAFPLSETEHLFAMLWDIHDLNILSATILPSERAFTYEKRFESGMRTQMHSHEYLELFYIIEGEYRQKILGKEYTFHKGEVCLIDKNCEHQEILDGTSATILFLGITNVMFHDIMEYQNTTKRIASFVNMALWKQKTLQQYLYFKPQADAFCQIEENLIPLLQELRKNDVATPFICQGYLLRIFWILSTQYESSIAKKIKKKMNWILFEEVTAYMEKNLRDMSVSRLAEEFNFQEDYFNRLLKIQTGSTYTEYLHTLRLRKAEELLLHTDLSIDDIAKEIGYKNKGYFYKIFAERNQLTPAQFRKRKL